MHIVWLLVLFCLLASLCLTAVGAYYLVSHRDRQCHAFDAAMTTVSGGVFFIALSAIHAFFTRSGYATEKIRRIDFRQIQLESLRWLFSFTITLNVYISVNGRYQNYDIARNLSFMGSIMNET